MLLHPSQILPSTPMSEQIKHSFPMLNILDDCSRLFTGSKIYEWELLLSHSISCPPPSGPTVGPCNSTSTITATFSPMIRDALNRLGWALKFYDISLCYAPTPKAKSNANTNFGRGARPPFSPVKTSAN
jgi:hypothetical protein